MPPWAVTALLALAALLPNLNSFGAYFVGDDFDFLVRMQRMDGLADAWDMSFWGEWEPLWYLGFYRDWKLWGFSPAGYHAASLFWLVLGVVGLYRLVAELLPDSDVAPWAAALLFATHPLHDEAVTYLAARGHPMSTALAVVALWLWVVGRREGMGRGRCVAWSVASLVAALAAAMAKETALMLPVWAAVLEVAVFGRLRPRPALLWRGLRVGLLFASPPAVYLALRWAAVGLGSHKLLGPGDGPLELFESAVEQIPLYALAGGLPLPFAFVDGSTLASLDWLGWLLAAAVTLPAVALVVRDLRLRGEVSAALGVYVTGLVLAVVGLVPVLWADLGLRRRYFYISSVGAALAAAVLLGWLARRRRRTAWALVLVLALGGAVGLVERNRLWRRAGEVTRDFVETVGGARLDAARPPSGREERRVALLTLPRFLGGDGFSGAYVLHRSDARSALRLAGVEPRRFSYGLKGYFVDDYAAEGRLEQSDVVRLVVSFRTARAYEAARERDPAEDREGDLLVAILEEGDDRRRELRYRVLLRRGFFADPRNELYVYGDERFRRLPAPAGGD